MLHRQLNNLALRPYPILLLILGMALTELFLSAWLSDDALITVRSVLNLISGYGPSFNLDERVQSFTHPLWFLLISLVTLVTRNAITSLQILSIGFSFAVLVIYAFKIAKTRFSLYFGLAILMCSKAYVDFSSSGLENPLSHLLLLLIILWGARVRENISYQSLLIFFLLCSLLCINRIDLFLIILPFIMFTVWYYRRNKKLIIFCALFGVIPLAVWTTYAIFYFGFPFPNTAYAKLGNIPFGGRLALIEQGLRYFQVSFLWDPITLSTIAICIPLGLKGAHWRKAISIGIVLYLIYIILIAGDFMAGRFFTAPLLLAVVILGSSQISIFSKKILGALFFSLAILGIYLNYPSFMGKQQNAISTNGVADERSYYFGNLQSMQKLLQNYSWKPAPRVSNMHIDCGLLGILSIQLGPSMHIADECALADPLLARLPIIPLGGWRIGHYNRKIPLRYEESLVSNINALNNSELKAYYEVLRQIVRGPLFSWERAKAIAMMNLGLINRPDLTYLYDSAMPIPELNERIVLNTPAGHFYLPPTEFGWSYVNQQGIWANNFRSLILFPLPEHLPKSLDLTVGAWIHPKHPKQDVKIFLNGIFAQQVTLDQESDNLINIEIPASALKKKIVMLEFEFLNAKRPKDLGVGNEKRIMGMSLEAFEYH